MSWTAGSPEIVARFALDPTVTFLNHGSFGATPRRVLDAQAAHRARLEAEPVDFMVRQLPGLLDTARARLAAFLHADPAGLVFVPNATTGVATVLDAFDWRPGDEVVLADHGYNAVRLAIRRHADRHGVKLVPAILPFPFEDPAQHVNAFRAALSPRTRLVVVDHLTSPTALVLPVPAILAEARQRGIPVLVNGAHAPATLPLRLDELGADFYTGNLHKWLCAPKGSAFLHLGPAWRDRVHPLVTSHGYGAGLHTEFDWTGTVSPSPWTTIPDAIDHLTELGVDAVRASNHALVQEGRAVLAAALGVSLPHPDDPAIYGPMAAVPFPAGGVASPARLGELNARLFAEHRIEVPFTAYDARIWVRISGQVYNHPGQYRQLAAVLRELR